MVHYDIYGYPYNPAIEDLDPEEQTTRKMQAKTKKMVLASVKVMLDNYDCEHIAIFKVM